MNQQPFKRAIAMFQAIAAAMVLPPHLQGKAMAGIAPYQSRGKGEGLSRNKHAKSSFKQNKRKGL